MAIKANVSLGVTAIGIVDTVLIQTSTLAAGTLDRISIGALSIHNDGTAGQGITVSLYVSPDLTSASGKRVAQFLVGDDDSKDANELIGQGLDDSENLIAIADVAGCNAQITVTQYTSGS